MQARRSSRSRCAAPTRRPTPSSRISLKALRSYRTLRARATAEEAVRIARLARELGCGDFVKIEIMRDSKYLLPDNYETIKATEVLANEGFIVLPYMYPDLNVARDLVSAGAAAVMPLGAPIGSNKGLATKDFIQILIDEIDLPIIVDAGIGVLRRLRKPWRWGQLLSWRIPRSQPPAR